MLCYDIRVRFMMAGTVFDKSDDEKKEPEVEERLQKLNAAVYAQTSEDDFYAVVYWADEDFLDFAVALWSCRTTVSKIKKKLLYTVKSIYNASDARIESISEITAKKYVIMLDEADNREYLKRSTRRTGRDLDLDYFDNSFFKINEELAKQEKLTKAGAIEKAKSIMADKTLYEEIERIYAPENARKFY